MKVKKIEISSFRGIINFNSIINLKSMVVAGPNGTGKSGIIDAFDFLLTGKIQRLSGAGTKNLNLLDHGKHIDKDLENSWVSAVICNDAGNEISVKRKLRDRKLKLINGNEETFNEFKNKMEEGQFSLSRRELLNFIVCEGGTRSKEIQLLLDVNELDKMRTAINSVVNELNREKDFCRTSTQDNLLEIDSKLEISPGEERKEKINKYRVKLGAKEIQVWNEKTNLIQGLSLKKQKEKIEINKSKFNELINSLNPENIDEIKDSDDKNLFPKFKSNLQELTRVKNLKTQLNTYELISLGLKQVGSENRCPLCDKNWVNHELVEHLKEKKVLTETVKSLKSKFDSFVEIYKREIVKYKKNIQSLNDFLQELKQAKILAIVNEWEREIDNKLEIMGSIEKVEEINNVLMVNSKSFIESHGFRKIFPKMVEIATLLPEESEEEKLFRVLMEISGNFVSFWKNEKRKNENKHQIKKVKVIQSVFERVRDGFFDHLYKEIEGQFSQYYKFLNSDEGGFRAQIIDEGNSVDLKVDFFGRGFFPPNALHSEGHQDGMGICLYLALMKKLKGPDFKLSLLDDVMMSIDIGHRRKLCELLKDEFKGTQFIITTHDSIWSKQLHQFNVVEKGNIFHFKNWTLETGPVFEDKDLWDIIKLNCEGGNISQAAMNLRNCLEGEFQEICSNLQAEVFYKDSHSWDLGELKTAGIRKFKKILGKAKESSISWNMEKTNKELQKIESQLRLTIGKSQVDEWQINPLVHFNKWANFSKSDFSPTIFALEELIQCFSCHACGGKMFLTFKKNQFKPKSLTCPCGVINYNLVNKVK